MHQRDVLIIQNQFVANSDLSNLWVNSYYKQSETGVKPILGVTWSPMEKLSLGAAVSTILVLNSSATFQQTCVNTKTPTNCDDGATSAFPFKVPTTTGFDDKRKYPIRIAVGAAYFASSSLLLSTDMTYHTAVNELVYGSKIATLDAAVGGEYYLDKKWAVRSGLFSNRANTPTIQAGVTNIEEHIDLYGVSLSFTRYSGDSSVTLGGNISYGVGLAQIGGAESVQNATASGWTIFLSSSY